MEALILTLPTLILIAVPVLLAAFVAIEAAEILSSISIKKERRVKKTDDNDLFTC